VPWRVIAVQDAARKKALRDLYKPEWDKYARSYARSIEHLEGEARAKQERTLAAATELADHFDRSPVILVFCFNTKEMAITDRGLDRPSVVGGGSIYPSVQNALLACRAEGLGCTITTLLCLREQEVKDVLDIPDDWFTAAAVPIGYPVGGGHGPISRPAVEKIAYLDAWGNDFT
jgi:nitroreductase